MGYGRVERRGSSSGLPSLAGSLHVVRRALTNRTTTTGSGSCAESESGGNPDESHRRAYVKLQVWTRWESFPPRKSVPSRCMITVSESPYRATSMTSDGLRLRARIALPRHRRHRPADLMGFVFQAGHARSTQSREPSRMARLQGIPVTRCSSSLMPGPVSDCMAVPRTAACCLDRQSIVRGELVRWARSPGGTTA